MTAIIEIKNLYKSYGKRPAVSDLSFTVEQGDIFGFVGPNGAGKTSTIRIMASLLEPTGGDIIVNGFSVNTHPADVRKQIGYMPDFFGTYDDMMAWEYLDFFGACYKIPPSQRKVLIDELLELVDLQHRKFDEVDGFSRGMKQRLSLARTLLHDPKILILDEPASGLDPRARAEIRELMRELTRMGKTIFFSTHILADVAEICTRVGIIEDGKLVAYGSIEDLNYQLLPLRQIRLVLLKENSQVEKLLKSTPNLTELVFHEPNSQKHIKVTFSLQASDQEVSELLHRLVSNNIPVLTFHEENRNMESVFMHATKGIVS